MPLEPPQPTQQYVIYGDEEDGPSTAEIIQLQSQDYVDEKLAQFEMMTIAKLQGMLNIFLSVSIFFVVLVPSVSIFLVVLLMSEGLEYHIA